MRFSKKSDYALRAMVMLAGSDSAAPISIRSLATMNDIPYRFLQQIALELKAMGWIETLAGRDGGIRLARPAHAISMGEIVRHFDGVLAPIGCVSTTHYERCSQEGRCRFRRTLLDIRNHTARMMDETTLAMLAGGLPPSQEEVFGDIFIHGAGI